MKLLATFVALLALCTTSLADGANSCDLIPINYAVFNLCPFATTTPFNVKDDSGSVKFGLGSAHVESCDGHETIWGVYNDKLLQCNDIGDNAPSYALLNDTDPESGLVITFPVQESANLQNQSYRLIVNLLCNDDATEISETRFTMTTSSPINKVVTVTVTGSSSYACPTVSFSQLINFIFKYKLIFAVAASLIGLFLTFFGFKLLNPAIFLISFVLGSLLFGTLLFQFTDFSTQTWIQWLIFGVSVIFGLILGYLAMKFEKLSYFAIGVALGTVSGLIVYNAFVLPFVHTKSGTLSFYITVAVCAFLGGLVALCLLQEIVIGGTAFVGAYLFVRGISIFVGGFPPETYVAQGIKEFTPVTYVYIVAIFVVAIVGIYYQAKSRSRVEVDEAPKDIYHSYYSKL